MPFTPAELARGLAELALPTLEALQIVSAEILAGQYYPHLDPSQPALVLNAGASPLPARIKSTLLQVYPPQHRLVLLLPGAQHEVTLATLGEDDQAIAVFIPPLPTAGAYAALQDIAARLRAPDGCPWDRALTWETLRPSSSRKPTSCWLRWMPVIPTKYWRNRATCCCRLHCKPKSRPRLGISVCRMSSRGLLTN